MCVCFCVLCLSANCSAKWKSIALYVDVQTYKMRLVVVTRRKIFSGNGYSQEEEKRKIERGWSHSFYDFCPVWVKFVWVRQRLICEPERRPDFRDKMRCCWCGSGTQREFDCLQPFLPTFRLTDQERRRKLLNSRTECIPQMMHMKIQTCRGFEASACLPYVQACIMCVWETHVVHACQSPCSLAILAISLSTSW